MRPIGRIHALGNPEPRCTLTHPDLDLWMDLDFGFPQCNTKQRFDDDDDDVSFPVAVVPLLCGQF
jgi:hypothetical protein